MKQYLLLLLSATLILADEPQYDFSVGNKLFTSNVYNELLIDNKNNILVSPFSAETIFALAQSGAKGSTAAEIRTALHLPDTEKETENSIGSVLPTIHSDHVSVLTANKIFVENKFPLKESFQQIASNVYQAEFQNIAFEESIDAAAEINEWVKERTDGKIQDLINADTLDDATKIVLVDVLYFQGNWAKPFVSSATKKTKFFTSANKTIDTALMYKSAETFNYYESEELDSQILELPFEGNDATMTIVLPNQKEGIAVLEKQMSKIFVAPEYKAETVQVQIPKFKIESTIDFKDVLEKMGVQEAFNPLTADFSGLAGEKGDIFISQAKQKTFIDVSENGVVAAAAATVSEETTNFVVNPAKYFTADHPFVFYIKVHDIVIFEGRVLVPEYGEETN